MKQSQPEIGQSQPGQPQANKKYAPNRWRKHTAYVPKWPALFKHDTQPISNEAALRAIEETTPKDTTTSQQPKTATIKRLKQLVKSITPLSTIKTLNSSTK